MATPAIKLMAKAHQVKVFGLSRLLDKTAFIGSVIHRPAVLRNSARFKIYSFTF
jgi:hypothetical protein